ncbi:hypothetical protein Glove_624g47 [Diversispora epigaea]|uniref:Uncharacterized protein n=1 Tax=Diversispora epigaea TaxID=1348612 RepID=A0A397G8L2_9GLOM|nr:hypothetical protein Glove_624g47 [Diversispora epigaea]
MHSNSRVVDNNWKPDYVCELDMDAIIYSTSRISMAQYDLGYCYKHGDGIDRDEAKAFE